MSWCAYVDESLRQRPDGAGIYVLAAAIVGTAEADETREAIAQLGHGKRRFHWRVEEPRDQRRAVALLAQIGLAHVVVVATRLDSRRQERGRRQCLERLLWELDQLGVEEIRLDERTATLNARDLMVVDHMRIRGLLQPRTQVDFARYFNGVDGEVLL